MDVLVSLDLVYKSFTDRARLDGTDLHISCGGCFERWKIDVASPAEGRCVSSKIGIKPVSIYVCLSTRAGIYHPTRYHRKLKSKSRSMNVSSE